jgi:phage gp45-like
MMGQIWRRLQLMIAQGVGRVIGADFIQVSVLDGETLEVKRVEPYGVSYRPLPGCQAYLGFVSGDRALGIALVVADKRYQLDLAPGEVALHDDQGQKVHLTRTGVVVSTPLACRIEAADIALHASHSLSWDVGGFGERWTATADRTWEHHTWQTGAVVTPVTGAVSPPEGP